MSLTTHLDVNSNFCDNPTVVIIFRGKTLGLLSNFWRESLLILTLTISFLGCNLPEPIEKLNKSAQDLFTDSPLVAPSVLPSPNLSPLPSSSPSPLPSWSWNALPITKYAAFSNGENYCTSTLDCEGLTFEAEPEATYILEVKEQSLPSSTNVQIEKSLAILITDSTGSPQTKESPGEDWTLAHSDSPIANHWYHKIDSKVSLLSIKVPKNSAAISLKIKPWQFDSKAINTPYLIHIADKREWHILATNNFEFKPADLPNPYFTNAKHENTHLKTAWNGEYYIQLKSGQPSFALYPESIALKPERLSIVELSFRPSQNLKLGEKIDFDFSLTQNYKKHKIELTRTEAGSKKEWFRLQIPVTGLTEIRPSLYLINGLLDLDGFRVREADTQATLTFLEPNEAGLDVWWPAQMQLGTSLLTLDPKSALPLESIAIWSDYIDNNGAFIQPSASELPAIQVDEESKKDQPHVAQWNPTAKAWVTLFNDSIRVPTFFSSPILNQNRENLWVSFSASDIKTGKDLNRAVIDLSLLWIGLPKAPLSSEKSHEQQLPPKDSEPPSGP